MKANELMIGDWVKVTDDDTDDSFIGQVKAMDDLGNVNIQEGADVAYPYSIDCLEPIPLTPEILEKNGWKHEFDKRDYMVKYDLAVEGKNCWMMWAVKEHNLDIQRQDEKLDMYNLKVQKVCTPCDYIHQLQHAIRLCGIEKEIEL